jgi:hypothetical protein
MNNLVDSIGKYVLIAIILYNTPWWISIPLLIIYIDDQDLLKKK